MESLRFLKFIFLVHFAQLILIPKAHAYNLTHSQTHVALFILGDSYFDAGNNNYINTTTTFQANFYPYGETFFKHPTGRHSNGRLIPDFIAEYAKLPLLPPYKQPGSNYRRFINGVNFASAGAGALAKTYPGMVIDLKTQLVYFKEVKKMLKQQLGEKEAKKILSSAVYLFNIGTNDYTSPFLTNSTVFHFYSQEKYVVMVIGNLTFVIKEMHKSGGRKFGFVNMGPLGCVPAIRALNYPANNGHCLKEVTALAKLHNFAFTKVLKRLETHLQGFKYSNFDFYTSYGQRIDNPSKYGFKEGKTACCGSGPYRGVSSCGGRRGVKYYELCNNPSKYVLFDYGHPSERANQQFANEMWSGTPNIVRPYNLKALFQ